jgi:branched-chain amino acid transport system substrate-binding protein
MKNKEDRVKNNGMKNNVDNLPQPRPEVPTNASRRDFIKKTSAAATLVAAPALLTKFARASERQIKIGLVIPRTGLAAAFTEPSEFVLSGAQKAFANGITVNGVNHPVEILVKDSQSDLNRTAQVTAELIKSDKVDLMLGAHTDLCIPVSDQCEINGVPCVTDDCPLDSWFHARGSPAKGFEWTYHFFWGEIDLVNVYLGIWEEMPSNKIIAELFTNDSDGVVMANFFQPRLKADGFTQVDPGRFTMMNADYSGMIAQFKKANAETCAGVLIPPDFSNFWQQALQQGYRPKVCTIAKAVLFPAAVSSYPNGGVGLTSEVWWSAFHPFQSSLTGQTAAQFCAEWEQQTGKEWTQPMGFEHALFEVANDVLKRTKSLAPEAIRDALRTTDFNSIVGPIHFNDKVPNCSRTPLVGGQWVRGKKYPVELEIIFNGTYPGIPKTASLKPIPY